jgi:hypothetical protein
MKSFGGSQEMCTFASAFALKGVGATQKKSSLIDLHRQK